MKQQIKQIIHKLGYEIRPRSLTREEYVNAYQHTAQGWQLSTVQDCADCEYVQLTKAFENWEFPNPIPVETDLAAGARAVACVHLIKD